MALDRPSESSPSPLRPSDESDESDEWEPLDESVGTRRGPVQLFGTKCETWDDVVAALHPHPRLLRRFRKLYRKRHNCLPLTFSADAESLELAGYFTQDPGFLDSSEGQLSTTVIREVIQRTLELANRMGHDFMGATLIKALSDVKPPHKVPWSRWLHVNGKDTSPTSAAQQERFGRSTTWVSRGIH